LNEASRDLAGSVGRGPLPVPSIEASHAPRLLGLIAGATAVGAVSGVLELLVHTVQLRDLHRVDWSMLMISSHASWMVVLVATVLVPCLAVVLMMPVLLWSALRRRQGASVRRLAWTWDLAGVILVTLLLLGPLLRIQGLHAVAPVAVALGAGVRFRRKLVWRSPAWERAACWAGGITIALLPAYSLWRWHRAVNVPEHVWSLPGTEGPNVLWIVPDTLRADHTSVHGYSRPTTPELEAWAKLGITFEMARSPAGWTLPSHVTMFTGLWPSQHGARVDRSYFGSSPTLAEHLRARGYATAGIAGNVRMCNRAYGLARGFDTHVDYPWNDQISCKAAVANSAIGSSVIEVARRLCLPVANPYPFNFRLPSWVVAEHARAWLGDVYQRNARVAPGSRRPYFLFLNFFDVHSPYLPASTANRRFWNGPSPPEEQAMPRCGWNALRALEKASDEDRPARRREFEDVCGRLSGLYDECIHEMDAEVGRLFGDLRKSGMLSNTWVVITSDHGEHFGEHNQFGHGSSLYNEATHVPLIVIPPLGPAHGGLDPAPSLRGRRIGVPISTRDLARTLADLTGPGAANPFPGHSLTRYWTGASPVPADPVFSQLIEPRLPGEDFRTENLTRMESIIDNDYVLIDTDDRFIELYQLSDDARQQLNLVDQPAEQTRVAQLRCAIESFRSELSLPPGSAASR
jgi:arylsulfatase A-like enzyme